MKTSLDVFSLETSLDFFSLGWSNLSYEMRCLFVAVCVCGGGGGGFRMGKSRVQFFGGKPLKTGLIL